MRNVCDVNGGHSKLLIFVLLFFSFSIAMCTKCKRLTVRSKGLDPAFPLYMFSSPSSRLSATDAKFVDVIHTDGGVLGFPWPLGHADFFPNGGIPLQPGCAKQELSKNRWFGVIGMFSSPNIYFSFQFILFTIFAMAKRWVHVLCFPSTCDIFIYRATHKSIAWMRVERESAKYKKKMFFLFIFDLFILFCVFAHFAFRGACNSWVQPSAGMGIFHRINWTAARFFGNPLRAIIAAKF